MTTMLTTSDVAARLGVDPATVRAYVSRGTMPKPDGHLGRTPWWRPETVDAWRAGRPGQGVGGGRPKKLSAPAVPVASHEMESKQRKRR